VTDVLGREIMPVEFREEAGMLRGKVQMDGGRFDPGLYFLKIESGWGKGVYKLVKE
jgi:hypothetical protein